MKFQERARAALQEGLANTPLPPAVNWAIQENTLRAQLKVFGAAVPNEASE